MYYLHIHGKKGGFIKANGRTAKKFENAKFFENLADALNAKKFLQGLSFFQNKKIDVTYINKKYLRLFMEV